MGNPVGGSGVFPMQSVTSLLKTFILFFKLLFLIFFIKEQQKMERGRRTKKNMTWKDGEKKAKLVCKHRKWIAYCSLRLKADDRLQMPDLHQPPQFVSCMSLHYRSQTRISNPRRLQAYADSTWMLCGLGKIDPTRAVRVDPVSQVVFLRVCSSKLRLCTCLKSYWCWTNSNFLLPFKKKRKQNSVLHVLGDSS